MRIPILFLALMMAIVGVLAQEANPPEKKELPPRKETGPIEFQFEGGSLISFLEKIKETFGTDIRTMGDVPESMLGVRLPKMRMKAQWYRDVLMLYNEISTQDAESGMGKWIIKDAIDNRGLIDPAAAPRALLLVGRGEDESVTVKAFPFQTGQKERFEMLRALVEEEDSIFRQISNRERTVLCTLRYHENAGVVVAIGNRAYTELVSELLRAFVEAGSRPGEVLITGQLNKPGAILIPEGQPLTIPDAIARAGGLTPRANQNKIKFQRPGQPEKTFSMDELKRETDPSKSITLRPGDVIEVPDKLF
jgi:protein involved in polysaccharide export with SLBB domain